MVAPETLEQVNFFHCLEPEEIKLVSPIAKPRSYKAGDTIFPEGEPTDALRVLVEGLVSFRQRQRGDAGETSIGSVNERGAAFGIFAAVSPDRPSPHSAVCVEDTEVIEVTAADLAGFFESQPAAAVHLLTKLGAVLAERLAASREQIRSRVRPGLISHG